MKLLITKTKMKTKSPREPRHIYYFISFKIGPSPPFLVSFSNFRKKHLRMREGRTLCSLKVSHSP